MADEYLLLKWGTLKGWNVADNQAARDALQRYHLDPAPISAALCQDTESQRKAICDLIDAINGEVRNDWSGQVYTKEEAKDYVLTFGASREANLTHLFGIDEAVRPAKETPVDNQHQKITGYRDLSQEEIDGMNAIKRLEQFFNGMIDQLKTMPAVDQRQVALAATHGEDAFMHAVNAIARPERVAAEFDVGWTQPAPT